MENSNHKSAPTYGFDSETISSSSLLIPGTDLSIYIIENYLDLFEVVEDTPEKVRQDELQRSLSDIRAAKRLKFDDPTGLLHIFLPRFFNSGIVCHVSLDFVDMILLI